MSGNLTSLCPAPWLKDRHENAKQCGRVAVQSQGDTAGCVGPWQNRCCPVNLEQLCGGPEPPSLLAGS